METVTIQSLSKTYTGGKEALKQLSLSLSAGEVFGFLGPNGAGKTTTVQRCIEPSFYSTCITYYTYATKHNIFCLP